MNKYATIFCTLSSNTERNFGYFGGKRRQTKHAKTIYCMDKTCRFRTQEEASRPISRQACGCPVFSVYIISYLTLPLLSKSRNNKSISFNIVKLTIPTLGKKKSPKENEPLQHKITNPTLQHGRKKERNTFNRVEITKL